jgi:hypothetical protein
MLVESWLVKTMVSAVLMEYANARLALPEPNVKHVSIINISILKFSLAYFNSFSTHLKSLAATSADP